MPLNRKAQIFTWDIILATVIFLIVLGTIIFLWTEILSDIDAKDTEYETSWLATAVSEQLARTPGSPANWADNPNIYNITVIGLADTRTIGNDSETLDRVLDPDKLIRFIDLSNNTPDLPQNNYSLMRNRLFGTGKYDYYIDLSCLDPTVFDCFEGLKFDNIANYNVTCTASNTTFYISNYTLRSDPYLEGIWRFDEGTGTTTADSSANGNDATIYGASWTSGKYKNALSFDGSTDYVSITNFPNSFDFNSSFSIEAWIYPVNITSVNKDIVSNWRNPSIGGVSNHGVFLEITSNGFPRFVYRNNGASIFDLTQTNAVPLNQWSQIIAVYDPSLPSANVKIYLNGSKMNVTANATSTFSITGRPLLIGSIDGGVDGLGRFFNGSIDDVEIWSRALSDTEVAQEYARNNKYCRFGMNVSIENTTYQMYDTKTVTFRNTRNETIFDDDTTFLKPTAQIKLVIYSSNTLF